MKVLLLTDYALSWDEAPPSRLLCLGREIARDNHTVRVAGSRPKEVPQVAGVEVVSLPHRADGGLKQALFPLCKEVRDQVRWCDAVIVRGYWIGFWAFWYALVFGGKRRIYDFHGMNARQQWLDRRWLRSLSTWVIEQTILTLATDVIAVTRVFREQLSRRRFIRRSVLLENGVDAENFESCVTVPDDSDVVRRRLGVREGRPVFTIVAHFGSWFELEVVVRAAALLRDDIELLLVGDGQGLDAARNEQQRLGLLNVHFTGLLPHPEVRALLTGVTYACICPYNASWPAAQQPGFFVARKVKEYLAAGKPVLCSDVPGREAFLQDGDACLLYRAGDSEDLARRMKELVGRPELARRLGARGRELVQGFSWGALYRSSGLSILLSQPS
jgi:glycosyltransferase involved in cell wall biosynthesis